MVLWRSLNWLMGRKSTSKISVRKLTTKWSLSWSIWAQFWHICLFTCVLNGCMELIQPILLSSGFKIWPAFAGWHITPRENSKRYLSTDSLMELCLCSISSKIAATTGVLPPMLPTLSTTPSLPLPLRPMSTSVWPFSSSVSSPISTAISFCATWDLLALRNVRFPGDSSSNLSRAPTTPLRFWLGWVSTLWLNLLLVTCSCLLVPIKCSSGLLESTETTRSNSTAKMVTPSTLATARWLFLSCTRLNKQGKLMHLLQ